MRLFEEIGTQLKGVADSMKDLTHEMREVRERLIRIEAQDQPKKVAALEADLRDAQDDIARVEREATDALAAAAAAAAAERTRADAAAAQALTAIAAVAAADKLALEKRLTRMETIIAPLTVGGSALLAAIIGVIVTLMSTHIH